jgi:hypothetical protein
LPPLQGLVKVYGNNNKTAVANESFALAMLMVAGQLVFISNKNL